MATDNWIDARNVLCVRLDTLGDVLMTTPALRALKAGNPRRRITLLTSLAGSQVAAMVPQIDAVLCYDAPWMKATPRRVNAAPDHHLVHQLHAADFDAAVVFTVFSQNPLPAAMLCYLAGIPRRLAHCRENPYQLLTHWVADPEPQQFIRHEVRRQLDLVAAVGCQASNESLSLSVPRHAIGEVKDLLYEHGVDLAAPWVTIHPGATAPSRRYPPESFSRVAKTLFRERGFQVVWTGTDAERELVEQIQREAASPSCSLAGSLDLGQLAALLSICPLLIANNTGPVHMAAALGTPVVDLYALTNPQHGPWNVRHRMLFHDVPCKYCYKSVCPEGHHRCLRLVEPEQVVEAAISLLESAPNATLPSGRESSP